MRQTSDREVQQPVRAGPGLLLAGLAAFLLAVTLLGGCVRLYELRQENQALSEALTETENQIRETPDDRSAKAAALGLASPRPDQVTYLHIREP